MKYKLSGKNAKWHAFLKNILFSAEEAMRGISVFYGLRTEFLWKKKKKSQNKPLGELWAPPMFTEEECLRQLLRSWYRTQS